MKYVIALIALVLVGGGAYLLNQSGNAEPENEATAPAGATVVADGSYAVVASESRVEWAGKKPLVDGYVNAGSIGVTSGTIVVAGQQATGEFTIDMNTLSVSATPKKPGQESVLEGHLKGERWFNVAEFPTAKFVIIKVTPRADSATTFTYDVTGNLTLKGQSHEVMFPAKIYQEANGRVYANGSLEIDRTRWGITMGSSNFFENLAENAIDDMVALSFSLVAEKK